MTETALEDRGVENIDLLGGPEAISTDVQAQIEQDTTSTMRLSGDDRHATAVALADFAMTEFNFHGELTVLSRSHDFPDALAAGLHAGRSDAPILLAPPDRLAAPAHDWLHDLCPSVNVVRALGGALAIAPTTPGQAPAARRALPCRRGPDRRLRPQPAPAPARSRGPCRPTLLTAR